MGGLQHYIETEGVATAGISLVREHTEKINPSRALWVPFELGRPLGAPNDPEFQLDVLRALLGLFEYETGPVIVDYPHDSPVNGEREESWSCVLPLPALQQNLSAADALKQSLELEVGSLMAWYTESVRTTGRTTFGLSGLTPDVMPEIARFLGDVAAGGSSEPPDTLSGEMSDGLRHLIDDVKSFYMEAAKEQPGASPPGGDRMFTWFFHETRMGQTLYDIRDRLRAEYEQEMETNSGQANSVRQPLNPIPLRYAKRP